MRRRGSSLSSKEKKVHFNEDHRKTSSFYASSRKVFLFCLGFRALNSLLVQTYFNPDEHWQALEVAHRIVFGYGHLTWEWKEGIRSYLHPLMFAVLYKLLAFLKLDSPWFMMKAPRLFQSIFSSIGDLYLYRFSRRLFGERIAQWAVSSLCKDTLSNWFMFFCITRTLSNSVETVLTIMGLFYWPSFNSHSQQDAMASRKLALIIAAVACAIRPTSGILWLYLGLVHLFETHDKVKFLFLEVFPIGGFVLMITYLLDWYMYGARTFVPLNFLKFNFLSSGGDYYGTHKWHWYFTQGFLAMLFTFLPFSAIGIWKSKEWKLSGLIAWVLGLYSFLGHKEFRFVLPVLPLALIFSGYTLAVMEIPSDAKLKRSQDKSQKSFCLRGPLIQKVVVFILLLTNVPMALYMSLVHQRGSEDVMAFLAKEAVEGKVASTIFLMPCHSTPYYSTLHHNLPMHFLDCSPSNEKGYVDESEQFASDPAGFASNLLRNLSSPSHVVLFDSHEMHLAPILSLHSYRLIKRLFHAHFKVDRELQASVLIYAREVQ
ncbi:GPI mannosyltransferase 3 isoform X1 [Amborella trichopoda]|uniref:GPI mannosyltransferase 3 isoform X1 n=1 Tax=Amborella trichopoda TaxID=13333 RepID=UPI0009BD3C4A|nr:GPI mannosyltransferase 3 isoform X1 [Amborella trichopoda]|eukprot:XP_020527633.1 GPI mannosyltransferase 3 isoform X1 [Amborella trichopoda]